MKKGYAVLGLGRFGKSIAEVLASSGADVLVVDKDKEKVHSMADVVTYAAQANVGDKEALESLGVGNLDCAIIAIGEDLESSVMATILLKELGVPYVIAKAKNELHKKILEKVGADKTIFPERESGVRIARNILSGNFLQFVELSSEVSMVELQVPREWCYKSLRTLRLRDKNKINVVAIKNNGKIDVNPDPDLLIPEGATLIITADNSALKKIK